MAPFFWHMLAILSTGLFLFTSSNREKKLSHLGGNIAIVCASFLLISFVANSSQFGSQLLKERKRIQALPAGVIRNAPVNQITSFTGPSIATANERLSFLEWLRLNVPRRVGTTYYLVASSSISDYAWFPYALLPAYSVQNLEDAQWVIFLGVIPKGWNQYKRVSRVYPYAKNYALARLK